MTYEDPILIGVRVAAGAAWLDDNQPGWVNAIDLDDLDLGDSACCVLGQVYGWYYDAPLTHNESHTYGFVDADDGDGDVWEQITAEWRRLISERRADAAAADREASRS